MKRDHSGWFMKYKVDLNPIAATFPEMTKGYIDPINLHSYAFLSNYCFRLLKVFVAVWYGSVSEKIQFNQLMLGPHFHINSIAEIYAGFHVRNSWSNDAMNAVSEMISMEIQHVSNSSTKSAEMIGNNDDILINILVRLPLKSLLRFRNVSKHWLSLISSPYFCLCLNERSIFPSALLLRKSASSNKPEFYFLWLDGKPVHEPLIRSLTFIDDSAGIKISQSCNGLLLCCSNSRNGEPNRNYYIYNPTTNQYTTLPKPGNRIPNTIFGVILAFDPSKSPHYKVVFVRSSKTSPDLYQLEIYSSETHLWSFSREIPKFKYRQGVYCSGAIHWISNYESLLCFDVDQESFQEMPMPEIPDDWNQSFKCRYFREFGGRLHLISTNGRHSTRQFDVYEMEKDSSRWFVKYQVDLNALISTYPEMTRSNSHPADWDYHAFRVLAVVCKEREGSFMVLHIPGKIISYSFKDKTSTLLHDFAPGCTAIDGCIVFKEDDAYPYTGTFAIV
ncbi:F-box protein At5g07610-like [Durio zibethinus]|uniref:F-box protein At5g07610-like n=1 Tax=Durio zibethinus TaxID=66656 RepID=A0A6P5YAD0_DURZI|nr:F-box protein At5g07610-like [Durio zibethinus]